MEHGAGVVLRRWYTAGLLCRRQFSFPDCAMKFWKTASEVFPSVFRSFCGEWRRGVLRLVQPVICFGFRLCLASVAICLPAGSEVIGADLVVRTIVGDGTPLPMQMEGPATGVACAQPFGLTTGPDGALYVCEVGAHVIRRVDLTTGQSRVVAGTGVAGYSGDGGMATSAKLNEPYEIRFDARGNLLFVEMQNHVVRRVESGTGVISTVAGCGEPGFSGDGGPAVAARLRQPHSIVLDAEERLYICDIGNHRIRRVDLKSGLIETFAGTGEKLGTPDGASLKGTPLNGPRAMDFDGQNALYLALREGNALFRVDLRALTLHHLAGTGKNGYSGDGGLARNALLSGPKGVAVSRTGDVYFADTESHTVRVYRASDRTVQTVIGDGMRGNGPDGPAASCRLDRPHGVYLDASGRLFVGDSNNHRVRVVETSAASAR